MVRVQPKIHVMYSFLLLPLAAMPESPDNPSPLPIRSIVIALLAVACCVGFAIGIPLLNRQAMSDVAVIDVAARSDGWADEGRCIDCHEQAEHFFQTGHANTLHPANDVESLRLLSALKDSAMGLRDSVKLSEESEKPPRITRTIDGVTSSLPVHWCFGSGAHARTWASLMPDSFGASDLLEFRWSWYHGTESFDLSPGHPERSGTVGVGSLGVQFDAARTWRCFSCHATRVRIQHGAVDEAHLHTGVTCQRCHGPRGMHVASEGGFNDTNFAFRDREESVRRCGQCHRNTDEQPPEDIRTDNPTLARFQPVGLSQSACYLSSQMTCTTCHDPHKPRSMQNSTGDWQCIQCHDPATQDHTTCGANESADCVRCHMPRIKQLNNPATFADHWIRVIREAQSQ